jgi:hypothetical protein
MTITTRPSKPRGWSRRRPSRSAIFTASQQPTRSPGGCVALGCRALLLAGDRQGGAAARRAYFDPPWATFAAGGEIVDCEGRPSAAPLNSTRPWHQNASTGSRTAESAPVMPLWLTTPYTAATPVIRVALAGPRARGLSRALSTAVRIARFSRRALLPAWESQTKSLKRLREAPMRRPGLVSDLDQSARHIGPSHGAVPRTAGSGAMGTRIRADARVCRGNDPAVRT